MSQISIFVNQNISFVQFQEKLQNDVETLKKDMEAFKKEKEAFLSKWNMIPQFKVKKWPNLQPTKDERITFFFDEIIPESLSIPEDLSLKYWVAYTKDHSLAIIVIQDPNQISKIPLPVDDEVIPEEMEMIEVILIYENQNLVIEANKKSMVKDLKKEIQVHTKTKEFTIHIEDEKSNKRISLEDDQPLAHYCTTEQLIIYVTAKFDEEQPVQEERFLKTIRMEPEETVYTKQHSVATRILEALQEIHHREQSKTLEACFDKMEFFVLVCKNDGNNARLHVILH